MGGEAVSVWAGSVVMMKTYSTWKQPLIVLVCDETLMYLEIIVQGYLHFLGGGLCPITAPSGLQVRF
jgi:hypothetical protein